MGYKHISNFVWIFISPLSMFIIVILYSINLGKNLDSPQETKYPRVFLCHKIVSTQYIEWQSYEIMKSAVFIENSILFHLNPTVSQEHSGPWERGPQGEPDSSHSAAVGWPCAPWVCQGFTHRFF